MYPLDKTQVFKEAAQEIRHAGKRQRKQTGRRASKEAHIERKQAASKQTRKQARKKQAKSFVLAVETQVFIHKRLSWGLQL